MSDELESVASLVHRFRVPRAGCTMNVCLGLPKICRAVERITIAEHYDRYRGPFKPRNRCFHRFVPPLGTSKARAPEHMRRLHKPHIQHASTACKCSQNGPPAALCIVSGNVLICGCA